MGNICCRVFKLGDRHYDRRRVYCISDNECPICLLNPSESKEPLVLTDCRHLFHKKCLDDWYEISTKCPICNQDL